MRVVSEVYEHGKAARMRVWREYLGLEVDELAAALGIAPRSLQRWESAQAPIPGGIWPRIEALVEAFDDDIVTLLEAADDGPLRVPVWRGPHSGQPYPGRWLRIVGEAMRDNPKIEPHYPDDQET